MDERDTVETLLSTAIAVVGGPPQLVEATRRAAKGIPAVQIVSCGVSAAATVIAEKWPFAIVMSQDVHEFDPDEFDALARDVAATLLKVAPEATTDARLEEALRPALQDAFRERGSE